MRLICYKYHLAQDQKCWCIAAVGCHSCAMFLHGQDIEGILTSDLSSCVVVSMVSVLVNIPQTVSKTHHFKHELKFPNSEQSKISRLGRICAASLETLATQKPLFRRHMHYWVALWMILDKLFQMLAGVAYCPKCLALAAAARVPALCHLGSDLCVPEQQVTSQWPSAGLLPALLNASLCSVLLGTLSKETLQPALTACLNLDMWKHM